MSAGTWDMHADGQHREADWEDLGVDALGGGLGGQQNVLRGQVWSGEGGKMHLQRLAGGSPGRLSAGGSPGGNGS